MRSPDCHYHSEPCAHCGPNRKVTVGAWEPIRWIDVYLIVHASGGGIPDFQKAVLDFYRNPGPYHSRFARVKAWLIVRSVRRELSRS